MKVKKFIEKAILSIMIILCGVMVVPVQARQAYTSTSEERKNSNYQRSQHTYQYTDEKGSHGSIGSSVFILYGNQDVANDVENFDFLNKFPTAYNHRRTDYFLAYCADLLVDFNVNVTYDMVNLEDSTFIDNDIKNHIRGIIKNTYPFITYDEMVNNLVDAGILVKTTKDGKEIITAKKNVTEENGSYKVKDDITDIETITDDELVSATQMAIFKYTDSGKVTKLYDKTYQSMKNNPVYADYEYNPDSSTKAYDAVGNNIEAIYNYLITLEEGQEETNSIKSVETQKVDNDYYLRITLNKKVNENDNLKLEYTVNDRTITVDLKNLEQDENGAYIDKLVGVTELINFKVKLSGSVYIDDMVIVYENEEGTEVSQSLIGLATAYVPFEYSYENGVATATDIVAIEKEPEPVENPNTIIGLSFAAVVIVVISLICLIRMNKKRMFIKG